LRSDVLVLGAGAAGIAAARALRDAGLAVLVLEARARIGGRVYTDTTLAPHPVELGAEFIHGAGAVTWQHVDRFGLHALPDANHGCYFIDGRLSREGAVAVPSCEAVLARLKARARQHLASGGPDLSIARFLSGPACGGELAPASTRLLNNLIASEKGADLGVLSLSGLLEHDFSGYGEGNYRIGEGYAHLLGRLAEGIPVRTGVAVTRVTWGDDGAVCATAGGEAFAGRHVVVTLPLGVLQAKDVAFEPSLPARKREAINRLGSAAVCKLFLKFRERFWPADMAVLCTTEDTQVWWPTGWGRPDATPLLTVLVGGQAARRFAALKEDAIPEALRQLRLMFGRQAGDLFEAGRVVAWHRKRYTRMGYSFLPAGTPGQTRECLAEPIPPTLFFAGEAAHSRHPSTVHGALESGTRAAREVLETRRQGPRGPRVPATRVGQQKG
jgi:monoamine oxidase